MDSGTAPLRKIIHIDMDAFYASVEQRDNPDLRGKPVAVGGARQRGVVAAASYEARVFGVKSAMPSVTALRKCPDLIFVKPRFEVYRQVSHQVREIFADYTPLIEPLSLDEAYLDVTDNLKGIASATQIAREIRDRIRETLNLTASAGVSGNKFLAKLASDQNKPDGLCVVRPEQAEAFVAPLPVRRFHGVGPVTAARMEALGIMTGADLKAQTLDMLRRHFGSSAEYYHRAARGLDDRPVRPDRERKSVGTERTFFDDLKGEEELIAALDHVAEELARRIDGNGARGRTVTLKIKFADFTQITRAESGVDLASPAAIRDAGRALLRRQLPLEKGVRLLGLALSNLTPRGDEAVEDKAEPQLALAL